MKNIKNVGVFLIDEKNRLLVVHSAHRGFNPPGGRIEQYDLDLFAAAEREFEEETNSKLPISQKFFESCFYSHRGRGAILFYNTRRLLPAECAELVKRYNRALIKGAETDDVGFVAIDKIVNESRSFWITGLKYEVRDRIAGFVPRVMKYLLRNTSGV